MREAFRSLAGYATRSVFSIVRRISCDRPLSATMKIIIPLQKRSTRIANKNFRPFYGQDSLFDIKAKQILEFEAPANTYVSSESPDVQPLAEKYGFNFLLRPHNLTGNDVFQPDYVRGLTDPLPGDDDIMWIHVTSPLFDEFKRALSEWEAVKERYDSLVAVKAFRQHLIDDTARPINFAYGYWHRVSQRLPRLYTILWSLFILKRTTVRRFSYQIGVNPYLFEARSQVIDIDMPEDFELAQAVYEKLRS